MAETMMKPPSERPTMVPSLWCGKRTCLPTILSLGFAYAQPANRHVTNAIAIAFTGSSPSRPAVYVHERRYLAWAGSRVVSSSTGPLPLLSGEIWKPSMRQDSSPCSYPAKFSAGRATARDHVTIARGACRSVPEDDRAPSRGLRPPRRKALAARKELLPLQAFAMPDASGSMEQA